MRTLAIETSGSTFSIALAEGGNLAAEVFWHSALTHSERLIPAIERLLADMAWDLKSLEKIAVSTGPGSFTGIRVGLTCARTMAQSLDLPLVGMSSLDILAAGAPEAGCEVWPVIDALREEVYVRCEAEPGVEIVSAADLRAKVLKRKKPVLLVGNALTTSLSGIGKEGKVFTAPAWLNVPRAGVLALAAGDKKGVPFDKVTPLYIRRSWAEERCGK